MAAEKGHNSGDTLQSAAQERLKAILSQAEDLVDERSATTSAINDLLTVAKGEGFDVKTIRKLIALRGKDKAKLLEEKAILELYAHATGCLDLV